MIFCSEEGEERPIERVMDSAFKRMRTLVDADIIVGTPIETEDGASIVPVSRVTMGFVTGGGEYGKNAAGVGNPFAGGSGGGVTVTPICFLVNNGEEVNLITINEKEPLDKILSLVPETIGKVVSGLKSKGDKKNEKNKR